MITFGSARRALGCAVALQRAFAEDNQRADEPIRIRVGLHTGEVLREADDFYGRHVNLASRIASEAGGGEILVSSLLRELTEGTGNFLFGEEREVELKGISGRQRVYGVAWRSHDVSDDEYLAVLSGIFRGLAAHDDVLIIGRGGQLILRDWPGAFHVLLTAPVQRRIECMTQEEGLSRDEAARRVRESDEARAAFHRKFFRVEVDHPSLYHLALNMGRVQVDEAVQSIAELAQRVAERPPMAPADRSAYNSDT